MSIEYNIYIESGNDVPLQMIVEKIKQLNPLVQTSDDMSACWIPSDFPNWVNFSMEKSPTGFFIVNNLNGTEFNKLFSTIESIFCEMEISFLMEEV